MRYILQIDISGRKNLQERLHFPAWMDDVLPVSKKESIEGVTCDTFTYSTDDKSIVEANWDKPYFYDSEYFIFLGGHVFFRISEADKKGKYVPSPEEVLKILIRSGDDHYNFLKGNYYIILYRRRTKTVTIFTSPLALYPAWYFIENGTLFIGNIMEALLRIKKSVSVSPMGLLEFSLFDHNILTGTIYNDLYQLNGGHILTVTETGIDDRLVYDIVKWNTKKPAKRKDSLEKINYTLKRHISEFTGSIGKFNISLTGGFDGRLNFSFIGKSDYARLQAFSYGMKGSQQLKIPEIISRELKFRYKDVILGKEFETEYPELGMNSIVFSGGTTPFIRAMYPYGYKSINEFSHNCILGQCDMIRPLYTNPAGAIFNSFSHDIFYNDDPLKFFNSCISLSKSGFLNENIFSRENIDHIYNSIREKYIQHYHDLNADERYYFFLMKESMLKFWQTECHLVDLFVNDFISFSDLDYIEALSGSEYFGLYKGIFAPNQFMRRNGQDLYADLMNLNNNDLNNIIVDRLYKPKWIRKGFPGYFFIALGKMKANIRKKKYGNDTFAGRRWSELFYKRFEEEINREALFFNSGNLDNKPYSSDNTYRYDRHISLKLWLQYLNLI